MDKVKESLSVEQGNRLIAAFLGAEFKEVKTGNYSMGVLWVYDTPPTEHACHNWNDYAMQYHSSWDWLIPAMQKAKQEIKIENHPDWGTSEETYAKVRLMSALNETHNLNIENAHYCFVKFVQWYNTTI